MILHCKRSPVQLGDKKGVIYRRSPEREALERWTERHFLEVERNIAKKWRRDLTRINFDAMVKAVMGQLGHWRKPNSVGIVQRIYPSAREKWAHIDPELYKGRVIHNLDPRGWQAVSPKNKELCKPPRLKSQGSKVEAVRSFGCYPNHFLDTKRFVEEPLRRRASCLSYCGSCPYADLEFKILAPPSHCRNFQLIIAKFF